MSLCVLDGLGPEPAVRHPEPREATTAAEAVLGDLELAEVHPLLVLPLNAEVHHAVDHVAQGVAPTELAAFGDVADDDRAGERLLRPTGDLLHAALGGGAGDPASLEVTVVHALERVNEQEALSTGTLPAELVGLAEELVDIGLAPDVEATETEAVDGPLDLEEAFLGRVVDDQVTCTGQSVGDREEGRRLAGTALTTEHRHRAGGEALTAEAAVEPVDTGREAPEQLRGDPDLVNARPKGGDLLELEPQSILR